MPPFFTTFCSPIIVRRCYPSSANQTFMWPFTKTRQKSGDSREKLNTLLNYSNAAQFLGGPRCAQLTSDERKVVEGRLSMFEDHMLHPQIAANTFGAFAAASLATYGLDIVRDAEE